MVSLNCLLNISFRFLVDGRNCEIIQSCFHGFQNSGIIVTKFTAKVTAILKNIASKDHSFFFTQMRSEAAEGPFGKVKVRSSSLLGWLERWIGLAFQIPGIWNLSWIFSPFKVPNSLQISSMHWKARARLYWRRFSRPNTRWKALDENYKFRTLLVSSIFIICKMSRFVLWKDVDNFINKSEKKRGGLESISKPPTFGQSRRWNNREWGDKLETKKQHLVPSKTKIQAALLSRLRRKPPL